MSRSAAARFRAVIFDLDGTLADTLATIASVVNFALRSLELPEHPLADFRQMVGEGVKVLCAKALPQPPAMDEARRAALLPELLARVRARYAQRVLDHARLYDGVAELLAELARRGARLAVLSNKPDLLTRQTLEGLGIAARFAAVLGQRDDLPPKPDPAGARRLLEQLRVEPSEVLYVGDSAIDMQTARNADFAPLGVLWGFRGREELLANGARWLVATPAEIAAIYSGEAS